MTQVLQKRVAHKQLKAKQIDIAREDTQLRADIIAAMKPLKRWREGVVTREVAVMHFKKAILDDLLTHCYVKNLVIVVMSAEKARDMRISQRELVNWWNQAWREVKTLLGPNRFKETNTDD